jgi:hypothetical protein
MFTNKTKSWKRTIQATGLAATLSLAASPALLAQTSRSARSDSRYASTRGFRLDAGTVIPVKLNTTLSSKDNTKGDPFSATVRTDDNSDYAGLPEGTKVEGVVAMAQPKEGKNPGQLDLDFRRLILPDGRSYTLRGSLIGLDNKSVKRADDGRLIATPDHQNKRLVYAGYGAGAGLIIGALSKHTLEDTLLGGGMGYLFGSLQKGDSNARDVVLKNGTELGVRLDRSVSLSDYQDDRSARDDRSTRDDRQDNRDDSLRYHRTERNRGTDDVNQNLTDRRDRVSANNASDIGVMLDDRDVRFNSNARPMMVKGVVMVPLRPVMDAANIPYTYNSAARQIRTSNNRGNVRLSVNSAIVVENGKRSRLSAPARMLNGTLYVPMSFLGIVTGYPVSYDSGSQTVLVRTQPMDDNNR